MKKRLLECDIHGPALFRCKRKCWKSGGKKETSHPSGYTEKCFKCISEGRYEKGELIPQRKRHIHLRVE